MKKVSVILPSYNEKDNIEEAIQRISKAVGNQLLEIIVVDDNSPDGTWKIVQDLKNPQVKLIRRMNEKGLASALDDGIKADVVKKDSDYGGTVGVSGTPAFFINGRFLGGAYPFASFKEVIDRELDGKGSDDYKTYSKDLQDAAEQKDQAGNPSPSFIAVAKNIDTSNSHVLGNNDAKVTIVEFTDFECPYCIRHFTQTWPDIKKNYIDTNKVKLIVKNYPLPFHPNAQKAAEAAECASDQGKYWEMHDAIFSAK